MENKGYPSKELIMAAQYKYKTPKDFTDWVNKTWGLNMTSYDFINLKPEIIAYNICKQLI